MTSGPQLSQADWDQLAWVCPALVPYAQEKQQAVFFDDGSYSFLCGSVRPASVESLRRALNSRGHFAAHWQPSLIHIWVYFDMNDPACQAAGMNWGMATWTWEVPPLASVACTRGADGLLIPLYHDEPLEGSGYVHETGHALNQVLEPGFAGGETYAENYSALMLQPGGKYPMGVLTPDPLADYINAGGYVPRCTYDQATKLYTMV